MQMTRCASPEVCALLNQSQADYNRLFNLSPDLICIAGLDGYFKRVNPSWTRTLGWSEAELLERPVEFFMHPEDRARTLQARAGLAEGIPVSGLENRYLCKDGSYRWLSWQSVTEPAGTTVFCVARDITERRRRDQEQLVMSKLESTGVLAGGIAHDFNNLLAGLLLSLEMLALSDTNREERDRYVRQAKQSILAAKSLTQQLLSFADGGLPARRITAISDLLMQSHATVLCGTAIHGECVIAPDLWPADVDEGKFGQALRHLLLNAREAMPDGGELALRAENVTSESGNHVRITIRDSGTGIPSEVLPKIFDPYFSTKRRGEQKGMGLGLTICRTIVHEHGGVLAIDSEPGSGTTATIWLPAVPAHRHAPETEPPTTPGTRPRVLVMDDEPLVRETLKQMLDRLGYAAEIAPDGEQAVELFRESVKAGQPFALALLDLTVRGGMGGTATLKALQAVDPEIPAVLMTGYTSEPAFHHPERHGFRGALPKPFSGAALQRMLADVLRETEKAGATSDRAIGAPGARR